jgi:photosystem II stability/assembly factor-like uncharacterized protein
MNIRNIFFIALIFVFSKSNSQQLYPTYWDSVSVLNDIAFPTDTFGIVVGSKGKIVRTNDKGFNWSLVSSPVAFDLNSVFFINPDTGFIAGSNGTVLRSSNAGRSWQTLTSNTINNLNQVIFFNANNGIAVGDKGTVIKTTDGGTSWVVQNSGAATTINFKCVGFSTIDTIFIGATNGLYQTFNSGTNWVKNAVTDDIRQIVCPSNNVIYVLSESNPSPIRMKTLNKGASWSNYIGSTGNPMYSIFFINDQKGFEVDGTGGDGMLRLTVNGGASFTNAGPNNIWPEVTLGAPGGYPYSYQGYISRKLIAKNNYFYSICAYQFPNSNLNYYSYLITKSTSLVDNKNILFGTYRRPWNFSTPSKQFDYNNITLLKINKSDSSVTVIDSTFSDSQGAFSFDINQDSVYVKISPNPKTFPYYIPCYHDSALTINEASLFKFSTNKFQHLNYKLIKKDTSSLGGIYKLGGIIYTNKSNNVTSQFRLASNANGVHIGVRVILINNKNKPVADARTDANGYFKFNLLDPGTYKIYVDYPYINNVSLAPIVTIASSSKDSLSFVLHKTYLAEEAPIVLSVNNPEPAFNSLRIFPNPGNYFTLNYELSNNYEVVISIFNMLGEKVLAVLNENQSSGIQSSSFTIGRKGIYFLRVSIGGTVKTYKLISN